MKVRYNYSSEVFRIEVLKALSYICCVDTNKFIDVLIDSFMYELKIDGMSDEQIAAHIRSLFVSRLKMRSDGSIYEIILNDLK